MNYKTSSIILNSNNNTSVGDLFIAQPDSDKENLVGKLFVLIEVESNNPNTLKVIDFIINRINYNYYQNEKVILRERLQNLKVEHIFETSLVKTNKDLAEFLQKEKIKISPYAFNVTVGVVHENNLCFSTSGKNRSMIIYKEKTKENNFNKRNNTQTEVKYKINDIEKNGRKKNQTQIVTIDKLFSNVISGSIPTGGYFLFSNETLPEYLSNKQLIEIITKLPPNSAAEQIKNNLTKINNFIPFFGIIIKNTTGLAINDIKDDIKDSSSSIELTEKNTEKYLSPSGVVNTDGLYNKISALFSKINFLPDRISLPQSSKSTDIPLKDKIFFSKKQTFSFKKIISYIKNSVLTLVSLILHLAKTTNKKTNPEKLQKNNNNLINANESYDFSFVKLSNKSKILLFSFLIFVLIFVFNLSYTNLKNKKIAKQETLNNLIEEIDRKQNQIDAYLLYNNEENAKETLNELKELLSEFPQETDDQKNMYSDYLEKHTEQLEKIQHVVSVENPTELANFSQLNTQANAINISFVDNKIYSGDNAQKTIYSLNLEDNTSTAIINSELDIKNLSYPALDKNNNIFYFNNSSILQFNTDDESFTEVSLELPTSAENIKDLKIFNNRLYLLDSQNNQIYRFTRSNQEYISKTDWLSEEADLSEAVSMSIDGSIYIAQKTGLAGQYIKGYKEDFELDSIEPLFENIDKIHVSENFIYILEASNNRLAIFTLEGEFSMQYHFDLDNIKDFAVDEDNKVIYILANNSVYKVEGEHFN